MLKFTPLPIFSSNYVWIIEHNQQAWVVDPGLAEPIINYLRDNKLALKGVLITHSHNDHIDGLGDLLAAYACPVHGPQHDNINYISNHAHEGDHIELWPDYHTQVLHLPGHLPEHLGYFIQQHDANNKHSEPALIIGDVLFSSGCGRMFSGPAEVYLNSLMRISELAASTQIYSAHEYSLDNIAFSLSILPEDKTLLTKLATTKERLASQNCSLPTQLQVELETNLFLRCHESSLWSVVERVCAKKITSATECFAALRALKDNW